MARIFMSISLLPVVLIIATLWLGWHVGDYAQDVSALRELGARLREADPAVNLETHPESAAVLVSVKQTQGRFRTHFLVGVGTALVAIFINCISVTYLIGTSRWVKEVTDAYGLDRMLLGRSNQLKRHTFPWSLAGVLSILVIVALGAASDPANGQANSADWVETHGIAAIIGAGIIVWAFMIQAINLQRNAEIVASVAEAVRVERERRGLPADPAPTA